jgi:hypothetical protein
MSLLGPTTGLAIPIIPTIPAAVKFLSTASSCTWWLFSNLELYYF